MGNSEKNFEEQLKLRDFVPTIHDLGAIDWCYIFILHKL